MSTGGASNGPRAGLQLARESAASKIKNFIEPFEASQDGAMLPTSIRQNANPRFPYTINDRSSALLKFEEMDLYR
jgi:hypothetical protein